MFDICLQNFHEKKRDPALPPAGSQCAGSLPLRGWTKARLTREPKLVTTLKGHGLRVLRRGRDCLCLFRKCCVYSVRIAYNTRNVSRIVCGSHLRSSRGLQKSQVRSTHYTRYLWALKRDPYTIYAILERVANVTYIVYGSCPTPLKCCK